MNKKVGISYKLKGYVIWSLIEVYSKLPFKSETFGYIFTLQAVPNVHY